MASIRLKFPINGVDQNWAASEQPGLTTYACQNVRPYDVIANRSRGGQRPGLSKWGEGDQIGGAAKPIVALCSITFIELDE